MISLVFLLMVSTSAPTVGVPSICRNVRSFALPEDQELAYQGCVQDEQTAREQLLKRWTQFSADARAICTEELEGTPPSYVEMLTCLEMEPGGNLGAGQLGWPAAPSPSTSILPQAPDTIERRS